MGNSFGISPSLDKQYMIGEVRTKGDDCQVKTPDKDKKEIINSCWAACCEKLMCTYSFRVITNKRLVWQPYAVVKKGSDGNLCYLKTILSACIDCCKTKANVNYT